MAYLAGWDRRLLRRRHAMSSPCCFLLAAAAAAARGRRRCAARALANCPSELCGSGSWGAVSGQPSLPKAAVSEAADAAAADGFPPSSAGRPRHSSGLAWAQGPASVPRTLALCPERVNPVWGPHSRRLRHTPARVAPLIGRGRSHLSSSPGQWRPDHCTPAAAWHPAGFLERGGTQPSIAIGMPRSPCWCPSPALLCLPSKGRLCPTLALAEPVHS